MTLTVLHHLLLLHLCEQLLLPLLLAGLIKLALTLALLLLRRHFRNHSLLLLSIIYLILCINLPFILHLHISQLIRKCNLIL